MLIFQSELNTLSDGLLLNFISDTSTSVGQCVSFFTEHGKKDLVHFCLSEMPSCWMNAKQANGELVGSAEVVSASHCLLCNSCEHHKTQSLNYQ